MKYLIFLILLFLSCFANSNDADVQYSDVTVDYVYPKDGSTDIPTNHKFVLHFNQLVIPDQVRYNVSIAKSDGTPVGYSFDKPDFDQSVYDAKNTFVLVPVSELDPECTYRIMIKEGMVSDQGGMLQEEFGIEFITRTAPGNDVTSPDNDHEKILKESIKIYFTEQMNPLFITESLVYLRFADAETIGSTVEYDFNHYCAEIVPDVPLVNGVDYQAIYSGTLEDLAGTAIGGVNKTIDFRFD